MSDILFPAGLIVEEPTLDLEMMQLHSKEWNIIYKEMGSTLCSVSLYGVHTPRIQLAHEYHSQGLMIQGDFPKKSVLLNYTKTRSHYTFQNRVINSHELVITQSGGELDFLASGKNEVFTIAIEETLFHKAFYNYFGEDARFTIDQRRILINPDLLNVFLQGLDQWISTLKNIHSKITPEMYEGIEIEILEHIFNCVDFEPKVKNRVKMDPTKIRNVLETNLLNDICIPQLAKDLRISERQLYHLFKSTYGFTPKKYLQKLRLNMIRDKLIKANAKDIKVSDIALAHCFLHMGHFSSEYKKMFKETPIETLYQFTN
jgi:AraC-like DNA-binding protein